MLRILFLLITISCFPACKDDGLDKPPTTNPEDTVELSDTLIIPPLQEMVVYEVNMRAFSDAGTFSGIQSRLDNIQDMGANVIWLMPIYPIGEVKTVNSPYCIRDYRAVNAEYGSLNTLKALVSAAHDRGMAVIIDWVAIILHGIIHGSRHIRIGTARMAMVTSLSHQEPAGLM